MKVTCKACGRKDLDTLDASVIPEHAEITPKGMGGMCKGGLAATITAIQARRMIRDELAKRNLTVCGRAPKLKAKTVNFMDLARGSMVFVKVEWIGGQHEEWAALEDFARANGFRVE